MMKALKSMLVMGALLGLTACGNDSGGPLLEGECRIEANFPSIHAVFSSPQCANSSCHQGEAAGSAGRLDLSGTPAEVHANLVGAPTANIAGAIQFPLRVESGMSATSYLLHMLVEAQPVGSAIGRMPVQGSLPDCEIDAITTWIDEGANETL